MDCGQFGWEIGEDGVRHYYYTLGPGSDIFFDDDIIKKIVENFFSIFHEAFEIMKECDIKVEEE